MNSRSASLHDWIAQQWSAAGERAHPEFLSDSELTSLLSSGMDYSDRLANHYELHLQQFDAVTRKARGVYYTPPEAVRFILRAVDECLQAEFRWPLGLLDARARILDPALGAGVFVTEAIAFIQRQFAARRPGEDWNEYVANQLLPRLGGIEILPTAAYVAMVRIALALAATGYRFESDAVMELRIADALAAPIRPAWNVIVGNPPFSGISTAKHDWLQKLLQGIGPAGEPRASYFALDGEPLRERKHWLQDDYVKFLRIAQEQIEMTGSGIVALVTSHGYLDNITFRGLRGAMLETFPRTTLIDLHGNAKRRERTPSGERDENVFAIEQGVAIGLWRRPLGEPAVLVERADIWGSRTDKLAILDRASWRELPYFSIAENAKGTAWIAQEIAHFPEYDSGWLLTDIFPLNTTAPVTARDDFVVAFTREELLERCRDLKDRSLSDDQLRARYFTRTRSRLYPPGDTRGWQLPQARERMRAEENCESLITAVQYRPFDQRWILWADWLIDWPRSDVLRHIVGRNNVTLIARRQAPPGRTYNYVWISDLPTLDGVIRSDNCGSESLFPLWTYLDGERRANLSPGFVDRLATTLRCAPAEIPAEQILGYCYALLSSPQYCARYAGRLRQNFPRIAWPSSCEQFEQLSRLGRSLFDVQLLRNAASQRHWQHTNDTQLAKGMPRYIDGCVFINANCHLPDVPLAAWEYVVGSHQVLRKYLKDRRGRQISLDELERHSHMVGAIETSLGIQREIDQTLMSMLPNAKIQE